ncbi:hypothetical protein GUITHDRAFT_162375 [Guillardia theta CCMP2712]|uniref:Transmembrane protein 53 n=2 Tax=Guillardia theta TaxID=55529 RepID=L1JIZ9_GUITC|nr:hypothetical protein GUITHDRAFT_162375 [Guillardia theta CCMP2712]EKX48471.1 hypothetical protein GUITHDRAFT_162375 [Guillardia theta CCMP2712]|mmetsp:Transcript_27140/g.88711  ORF Transcript_27140/g.88711 Transcript_27140/m.88711 type:complete len:277 (+) Transcript_27140:313-1143(+)|eukprot:XP_005835451.1 hypothetical protein GUITHDRAFT_162375 [Guillardia theta CCMP2712]
MPTGLYILEGKGGKWSPPAVIVLFGWFGAPQKHLLKYAEMYQHKTCGVIIRTTASSSDIMLRKKENLARHGMEAIRRAAAGIESLGEEARVYVHCISNGGTFLWDAVKDKMIKSLQNQEHSADPDAAVLRLIHSRLAGEIFDSAPCYISTTIGLRAIRLTVQGFIPRLLVQLFFLLHVLVESLYIILTFQKHIPEAWWDSLIQNPIRCKQLFLYSDADSLLDRDQLQLLIESRRENGVSVQERLFHGAGHVQLLRNDPQEYTKTCLKFCGLKFDEE